MKLGSWRQLPKLTKKAVAVARSDAGAGIPEKQETALKKLINKLVRGKYAALQDRGKQFGAVFSWQWLSIGAGNHCW